MFTKIELSLGYPGCTEVVRAEDGGETEPARREDALLSGRSRPESCQEDKVREELQLPEGGHPETT